MSPMPKGQAKAARACAARHRGSEVHNQEQGQADDPEQTTAAAQQRVRIPNAGQPQAKHRPEAPNDCVRYQDGVIVRQGKPWVPEEETELLQRIMVVAHCGA
ncbi:TPA: hypothetical protein N0F65_004885 [Lagenidium giganteum]|uniref:Uncharacterized protein n=1 Tax=Lagenidium giganteum TaxID=4803 RepID=A0AAV2ZA96_9STRA|nr:TPA: hypothetical protein N0F65_004885 [Lagenidium giganteum]